MIYPPKTRRCNSSYFSRLETTRYGRVVGRKGRIEEELARIFDLTPEQLELTTNDGEGRNRWDNWLRQVKRMLVKKKYLDDSIHDVWRITHRGMQWLEKKGYWQQFPA